MLSRGGRIGRPVAPASEPGPFSIGPMSPRLSSPAWYDVTWNPTVGCSPVGPGCDQCEALRTVAQLARMGGKGGARYAGLTTTGRARLEWSGELHVRDDVLTWPLLQRRRRRILVGSLSDPFHETLTTGIVDAIHAVMTIAHWHRFIMLTRRAERMRAYYADPRAPARVATQIEQLAAVVAPGLAAPRDRGGGARAEHVAAAGIRRNWPAGLARAVPQKAGSAGGDGGQAALDPWPLPNMSLGVAVESQAYASRIGELLQTPADLRWVCFEPLLGPVQPDLVPVADGGYTDALRGGRFDIDWRGRRLGSAEPMLRPLDWVVAGGETGPGARPTDLAWVQDLRDRCTTAGVPFFFKQWGEWASVSDGNVGRKVVRRGHRAAGRLIDGRSWDEIPAAMREHRPRLR